MFGGNAVCQLFLQANRVYYNMPAETKIFACTMTTNLSLSGSTVDYTPVCVCVCVVSECASCMCVK